MNLYYLNYLKRIKHPIREEIKIFEKKLSNFFLSKKKFLIIEKITNYIINRKGKLIRPMFVLLIAKMFSDGNNVNKKTYHIACLIELIHIATLVHDDVVDNSKFRRGSLSINAIWKNKIAVLIGDYLLSKSFFLATKNNYFDILKVVCQTMKDITEGELLQIEKSNDLNITENTYFYIIYKKTASLISASCECGALSVGTNKENINKIRNFGVFSGIAFQIKDDLFDYEYSNKNTGKSVGIDFEEKKITLPLIYTFKKASKKDKKYIIYLINKKKRYDIINYVKKYNGLEYAKKKMMKYHYNALQILENYPDNNIKKSLKIMINFIVDRNR